MSGEKTDAVVWPEPVDIREVWPGEAMDFTPWLARPENLDHLGEILGLGELVPVGAEVTVPGTGRSLDILAETLDGARVAIENQYGEADHDHLTRGLAYAVGLNAAALVVIAENHRPEFVAVADYYNGLVEQVEDRDVFPIFLLNLTVRRAGGVVFPAFDICARPNEWRRSAEGAAASQASSFEDALATFPADEQAAYRAIADAWARRPGCTLDWAKQSFLLRAGPGRRPPGVLQFSASGRAYGRRDVISRMSGLEPGTLDVVVSRFFPGWSQGKEEWYLFGVVSPVQSAAFIDEVFGSVGDVEAR